VVVFGPNPEKKFARQTSTTRPREEIDLKPKPKAEKVIERIMNPQV